MSSTTTTPVVLAHRQGGRADGTWGCACGWVQDKPYAEHVADMLAAAANLKSSGHRQ
jgi:hypothetical protein